MLLRPVKGTVLQAKSNTTKSDRDIKGFIMKKILVAKVKESEVKYLHQSDSYVHD
jgi:hypothetical protein